MIIKPLNGGVSATLNLNTPAAVKTGGGDMKITSSHKLIRARTFN